MKTRTLEEVIAELEKRARHFKRRADKTGDRFYTGAYSNLEAMALWAKNEPMRNPRVTA